MLSTTISHSPPCNPRKSHSEVDKRFASKMRLRRRQLGLHQSDVAARLNCSPQTVAKWEYGERKFYINRLPDLAKALEVPITYFFED